MSDRRLLEEFLTCSAADISVIANYLEDRDAFPVVPFQVRLEHVRLARLKSNCDVMCYAEGGSVRSFQSMKNEGSVPADHIFVFAGDVTKLSIYSNLFLDELDLNSVERIHSVVARPQN